MDDAVQKSLQHQGPISLHAPAASMSGLRDRPPGEEAHRTATRVGVGLATELDAFCLSSSKSLFGGACL